MTYMCATRYAGVELVRERRDQHGYQQQRVTRGRPSCSPLSRQADRGRLRRQRRYTLPWPISRPPGNGSPFGCTGVAFMSRLRTAGIDLLSCSEQWVGRFDLKIRLSLLSIVVVWMRGSAREGFIEKHSSVHVN
jgi:hypothetical protein